MNKNNRIFLSLTLAMMVIIFIFSSQPGPESQEVSDQVVAIIMQTLPEDAKDTALAIFIAVWIRKIAHFIVYFLLGLFANLWLKGRHRSYFAAWAIATAYAASDEFHQLFVPNRCGMLKDVALDSIAALTATLIVWGMIALIGRKASNICKEIDHGK